MELSGKVCLVTGGNSGIGAATAVSLARRGAKIVTASRRGADQKPENLSAIEGDGTICFLKADFGDPTACRNCVDEVVKQFGRLDVAVHSAGGAVPGGLYTVTEEAWMEAFAVHVHSVFHLARSAAPHAALLPPWSRHSGPRRRLGIAQAEQRQDGAVAAGVARALARELADQNIRVNCVSPGVIRTPFQASLTPEQTENNIQNRIPLHREGRPEEVAKLIVSLLENDFITGENFVIDGGMTMRVV